MYLWLFLALTILISCGKSEKNSVDSGIILCSRIDSLELIRLGKPDYEDLGYYPLEKLSISLQTSIVHFTQNDTLIAESTITAQEVENIKNLLGGIQNIDKNRIYNPSMSWSVELELRVFCEGESGNFVIKSFGQNGQTPSEVKKAYRPLLRRMAKFSSKAAQ